MPNIDPCYLCTRCNPTPRCAGGDKCNIVLIFTLHILNNSAAPSSVITIGSDTRLVCSSQRPRPPANTIKNTSQSFHFRFDPTFSYFQAGYPGARGVAKAARRPSHHAHAPRQAGGVSPAKEEAEARSPFHPGAGPAPAYTLVHPEPLGGASHPSTPVTKVRPGMMMIMMMMITLMILMMTMKVRTASLEGSESDNSVRSLRSGDSDPGLADTPGQVAAISSTDQVRRVVMMMMMYTRMITMMPRPPPLTPSPVWPKHLNPRAARSWDRDTTAPPAPRGWGWPRATGWAR